LPRDCGGDSCIQSFVVDENAHAQGWTDETGIPDCGIPDQCDKGFGGK